MRFKTLSVLNVYHVTYKPGYVCRFKKRTNKFWTMLKMFKKRANYSLRIELFDSIVVQVGLVKVCWYRTCHPEHMSESLICSYVMCTCARRLLFNINMLFNMTRLVILF